MPDGRVNFLTTASMWSKGEEADVDLVLHPCKLFLMSATPILFLALFGALLLAPKAGCQEKTANRKIDTLVSMDELDDLQKLKPGYFVSIRILEDKRDALHQRVSLTGEIQAPCIGLIKAEGLTCRELAFKIKPELKKLEKDYLVNFTINPPVEKTFLQMRRC